MCVGGREARIASSGVVRKNGGLGSESRFFFSAQESARSQQELQPVTIASLTRLSGTCRAWLRKNGDVEVVRWVEERNGWGGSFNIFLGTCLLGQNARI